ncbi:MAG: LysM peptidoglycan-binding domain-containing protein [Rhodocyclaceae bacterium]|nr:LysM peptidoglycan-binding domain-containing protein [Rhodocyclaceae bacterium]
MTRIIFSLLTSIAALLGANAATAQSPLAANAPDSHVVVPGDTLWGISGKFLKEPWRWPEVWRMNREQIRNPHLIYPGQVVYLDRSGPYLRLGKQVGDPLYEKRFPQAYSESLTGPITSISIDAIKPFLSQPLVVDEEGLANSATVIAVDENQVFAGKGDTIFAKDVPPGTQSWQLYRPAQPIKDPITGEVLAFEAFHLGSAQVTEDGEPATLRIVAGLQEIGKGDRMLPSPGDEFFSFAPHAPEGPVAARIASIYAGVNVAGRNDVITISYGEDQGAAAGQILALYRNRGTAEYTGDGARETFVLPEKRYGLIFVFRTFSRLSYALILDSNGPATIGDSVRQP